MRVIAVEWRKTEENNYKSEKIFPNHLPFKNKKQKRRHSMFFRKTWN